MRSMTPLGNESVFGKIVCELSEKMFQESLYTIEYHYSTKKASL